MGRLTKKAFKMGVCSILAAVMAVTGIPEVQRPSVPIVRTASAASYRQVTGALTAEQARCVMFDHIYYANRYSDLKAAYGYNEALLWHHYITWGIAEGRSASPVFDPIWYLDHNKDLKRAFGNNYAQAYQHWIHYGCSEGRDSSEHYHGRYYLDQNADLKAAYFSNGLLDADNYYRLALHYLKWGCKEGRCASQTGKKPDPGVFRQSEAEFDPIWPCDTYTITTLYKYSSGSHHSCHFKYGIDIGGRYGENVYAVESGTVMAVKNLGNRSFGKYIYIKHDNGRISVYAHLSSQKVAQGTRVSKGQVIGKIGNTGNVATHLHFELGHGNVSPASNDGGDPWAEFYASKYGNRVKIMNRQDRW